MVRLEPLREAHADALFDGLSDPDLYTYLDEAPPPSLDWLRRRFATLARGAPPDVDETWRNWVIVAPDGRLLGTTQATIRPAGPTSIAYVLVTDEQHRGYGRAAVRQMLQVLAADHGRHDLQAEIDPRNERSARLVRALGFTRSGTVASDDIYVRRSDP